MNHASTFRDFSVKQHSIIFCDIDETVLCFGKEVDDYWKMKVDDPNYDIWFEMVDRITPNLTCSSFHEFIKRIDDSNSTIHFITARNPRFKEATERNMKHHGLSHIPIHFLAGASKSKYINENFNLNEYPGGSEFIDDSDHNVNDVSKNVEGCRVTKFKKIVDY